MTKVPHLHWAALSGEGDWTTAADWDTGTVPTGDEVAALDKAGTYQVDVNGDVSVEEIKVNTAGATLVESASGHLATRTFFIEDGTAELNAANDIQNIVADGGALILVDRGRPHDASRRALCAGLTEIEQRQAGRAVITSGLVSHFV